METGKTSRYFKYAIGEIILVVIGILIALQVSNWNDERKQAQLLNSYYTKLHGEVNQNIAKAQRFIALEDTLIEQQRRTLQILNSKNEDDIPELKENIGAVATAWYNDFSFVIFDEFLQKGLVTKIKDQNLKQNFQDVKLELLNIEGNDDYVETQYNTLIEPFFAKHINYSNNAMKYYRKYLVEGGPKTDFNAMFNSMELWNITTLKLESTSNVKKRLELFLNLLEDLKENLNKQTEP
ncbi:hypothetical protein Q2T40_13650 [Winogradskyella maritima]|uniref:PilJ/NarX-like methyl-accepting chemotaxis transducer n=1 Tax=Winogradskyella maritima TaxID=1517766 RepID=A0ABV8AKK2_9FLAO|nr:hypothetical protein [Winogradskyella maritima]